MQVWQHCHALGQRHLDLGVGVVGGACARASRGAAAGRERAGRQAGWKAATRQQQQRACWPAVAPHSPLPAAFPQPLSPHTRASRFPSSPAQPSPAQPLPGPTWPRLQQRLSFVVEQQGASLQVILPLLARLHHLLVIGVAVEHAHLHGAGQGRAGGTAKRTALHRCCPK